MRILKIKGKDEGVVLQEIKKEYGDSAIIISSTQEKKQGFLGIFKHPSFVVTIAVNEDDPIPVMTEMYKSQPPLPKKDPNYEATQQLLLQLKEQLQDIRNDMYTVKHATIADQNEENNEHIIKKNKLYYLMCQALKAEGIEEEVASFILQGTEDLTDIGEVARKIYTCIIDLLQQDEKEVASRVVFFVGSTGVGKTTTIAKLTATEVLKNHKQVGLFTADTYRIAAIEQLKTYADILNVPIEIIYSEKDLLSALDKWQTCETLFIDTAGRSHKNEEQIQDIKTLLSVVKDKKVYLVLNMNTTYRDIKQIIDIYRNMTETFELIITKLDETDEIGNLVNIAYYAKAKIAYITDGQNVPEDFKRFDAQDYAKTLLGRIEYE